MNKINKKYAAVLFDLDGTIADTAPDLSFALNEMLIWRSCEIFSVSVECVSKNYPKSSEIQLSTSLGERVKVVLTIDVWVGVTG